MATPRVFYLVPKGRIERNRGESRWAHLRRWWRHRRAQPPVGGVKVIYQHCDLLREAGVEAHPVHVGGDFRVDWFPHRCEPLSERAARREIGPDDVLLCPEIIPGFAAPYRATRRLVFAQAWNLIDLALRERGYEAMGFCGAIACSPFVRAYLRQRFTAPTLLVRNGIDLGVFSPEPARRRPNRLLYLARKNAPDGRAALAALPAALRAGLDVLELSRAVTQDEMVRLYQETDIFMATGYPEGFSLPPLEAMACGAAVVGFTGGGGGEFMRHEETALVAPDADVPALADCLQRVLRDRDLRERLRAAGHRESRRHGLHVMRQSLAAFAELLHRWPTADDWRHGQLPEGASLLTGALPEAPAEDGA